MPQAPLSRSDLVLEPLLALMSDATFDVQVLQTRHLKIFRGGAGNGLELGVLIGLFAALIQVFVDVLW